MDGGEDEAMEAKKMERTTISSAFGSAITALLPIAKSALAPIVIIGKEGADNLMSRAQSAVQYVREEIEDIVAEAQFERFAKREKSKNQFA
jgi:hypothetical protein